MRASIIVGLAVLGLALGACDKPDPVGPAAAVKPAAKTVASDEDLARARAEVEQTAEDAGAAVTAASER